MAQHAAKKAEEDLLKVRTLTPLINVGPHTRLGHKPTQQMLLLLELLLQLLLLLLLLLLHVFNHELLLRAPVELCNKYMQQKQQQ